MMPCFASISACAFEAAISWRNSLRSTSIEALISAITASGCAEKRPPHILLLMLDPGWFALGFRGSKRRGLFEYDGWYRHEAQTAQIDGDCGSCDRAARPCGGIRDCRLATQWRGCGLCAG